MAKSKKLKFYEDYYIFQLYNNEQFIESFYNYLNVFTSADYMDSLERVFSSEINRYAALLDLEEESEDPFSFYRERSDRIQSYLLSVKPIVKGGKYRFRPLKGYYDLELYHDTDDSLFQIQKDFLEHIVLANQMNDSLYIHNFLNVPVEMMHLTYESNDVIQLEEVIEISEFESDRDRVVLPIDNKLKSLTYRIKNKNGQFQIEIDHFPYPIIAD